jgi:hypothetical protein
VRLDGSRCATTDENGIYRLDAVAPGEHRSSLDLTSVRADLTMLSGGQRALQVDGGRSVSNDFLLVRTGRIAGLVFIDSNGNSVLDAGEQPLADVRVVTSSGRDTLTDGDGAFSIADLAPGDHVVLIDESSLPERLISGVGSVSVRVFEARETGGIRMAVVPAKAEVKHFSKPQN